MANETVPGPASGGGQSTGGLALVENAEAIARLYRRLVLLVGVQILFSFLRVPLVTAVPAVAVPMAVIVLLVLLGTAVALALTAYTLRSKWEPARHCCGPSRCFCPASTSSRCWC